MMIDEQTVFDEIWPVVEKLIEATIAEDDALIPTLLVPDEQAAEALDLFGFTVFDILLKTVLGRGQLGLTRAIETDDGRSVYIEYAWPDPEATDRSYTAADVVSVRLQQQDTAWLIAEVNPAAADLPLTSSRARTILTSSKLLSDTDSIPSEPWILPIAFWGGMLQIPLQKDAMQDEVERLLLPGLQHRTYGMMSLIRGRRLWRDFYQIAQPQIEKPAEWAAAVEYILSKQNMRNMTQAAVGKHYKVGVVVMAPHIKQIERTLNVQGLDERYTDIQTTQIVYDEDKA